MKKVGAGAHHPLVHESSRKPKETQRKGSPNDLPPSSEVANAKGPDTGAKSRFESIDVSRIGMKGNSRQPKAASASAASNTAGMKATGLGEGAHLNAEVTEFDKGVVKSFHSSIRRLRAVAENLATVGSIGDPLLLLDFGMDPSQSFRYSQDTTFVEGRGIYVVMEAYSLQSSGLSELHRTREGGAGHSTASTSSTTKSVVKLKRHKGFGGIIGEGGHFEKRIHFHDKTFYNLEKRKVSAFGMRLRLESIVAIALKKDSAKRSAMSKGAVTEGWTLPRSIPFAASSVPAVLVLSSIAEIDTESLPASAYYPSSSLHVIQCLDKLRKEGVSCTGYIHLLLRGVTLDNGGDEQPTALSLWTLCKSIGVSFIVQLVADAREKRNPIDATVKMIVQVPPPPLYSFLTYPSPPPPFFLILSYLTPPPPLAISNAFSIDVHNYIIENRYYALYSMVDNPSL